MVEDLHLATCNRRRHLQMKQKLALVALLLLFWSVSLRGLDMTPPVYEDEPWQSSTGWKLATEGLK